VGTTKIWVWFKIVTTISLPLYKGVCDLLLKAASFIEERIKLDFDWEVYGIDKSTISGEDRN
jgi:hypothetical protein